MDKSPADRRGILAALEHTAYLALIVVMVCLPSAVPVLGAAFIASLYFTSKKT